MIFSDLRTAWRRPAYPLTALLTLALGVGASTAVFAVVNAALLQRLPFAHAERVVAVWRDAGGERLPLAAPDVAELAQATSTIDEWAYVLRSEEAALGSHGEAVPVAANVVSANLFAMLGVTPAAGRLFTEAESFAGDPDAPPPGPVLLDYGFWQRQFGGSASVIGASVRIDDGAHYVVGILPPGFRLPLAADAGIAPMADVWRPIRAPLASLARAARVRDQDSDDRGVALARLLPRATALLAQSELERLAARSPSLRTHPTAIAHFAAVPIHDDAVRSIRPLILLLVAAIAAVLLLAAANVAGLLAARTAARRRELALRAALGSSRWQLIAPVLMEGLAIGVAAAVLGCVFALWGVDALMQLWPPSQPLPAQVRIDPRVLAFGAASALGTALLATLLPAVRGGQADALAALRGAGTVGADARFLRIRDAFIVTELVLSIMLLSGTGLLVRTFANLNDVEPGFRAHNVATFDVALIYRDGYRGPADRAAFVRALEERLRALPGVNAVGVIAGAPLRGESFVQPWGAPGTPFESWAGRAEYRVVSADYFAAIGTRILRGRSFVPDDDRQDRRVVIIDQALAERFDGDALGHTIAIPIDGEPVVAEIVGVAENARFRDLRTGGIPAVYVPYRHEASRRLTVIMHSEHDPTTLAAPVRAALHTLDARLPVFDFRTMDAYLAREKAGPRFALLLLGGFGILAALIAATSIYSLLEFTTARRTGEFGIRMLLGAEPTAIVRLVLAHSLRLTLIALPAGLGAALATGWLMRRLLFGVSPLDPIALTGAIALLAGAVAAASIAPALRAARIEPAAALRR